jgi:hypothetical protein
MRVDYAFTVGDFADRVSQSRDSITRWFGRVATLQICEPAMAVLFRGCNEPSVRLLREIQAMRSGNFSVAV